MEPEVWGPPAWTFLHTITLNYPENPTEEDKKVYGDFFKSLEDILPCSVCRKHYKKNIKENPINLESNEGLTKWLVDIHNKVNEYNGKKLFSYDSFINKYSDMYNNQKNNNSKKIILIILIIIFICSLYKLLK